MTAICQLKLPTELQQLVRSFVYYPKIEHLQRKRKRKLIKHLGLCERLYWNHSPLYDYFYYKVENWNIRVFDKDTYYISQHINIFSCIFCTECHGYAYSNTHVPETIMCGCLPIWVGVD